MYTGVRTILHAGLSCNASICDCLEFMMLFVYHCVEGLLVKKAMAVVEEYFVEEDCDCYVSADFERRG